MTDPICCTNIEKYELLRWMNYGNSGVYYGYYGCYYGTKFREQCRQCVVTGCSCTAVDVPITWRYVYCIYPSSAFMALKPRRTVKMQLNADIELSFLATRHVVEWRPTAATIPPNVYLGYYH